ncbi:MAG: aldehyde reductase [Bacteroidales bacterium]|nr:aldehyde reductase [Bacteroidales bacterium]MCF8343641.1 aldehyde reductase [Bacteroidales bacterium]MCF8352263.1 aldehyde reductase [Bacteroidales bacterium]MCF8375179.1 aldehyde reductase [Bacteroidales bacterium]MCF8400699.1 aldehyde reductase [Bacteroidales bacterium]
MEINTVMVTGGTGYIGSWVVKDLLENGYNVRLAARNKSNKSKFEHLLKIAEAGRGALDIWEADLLKEGSFDEAAKGCEAVMHIASPFTLRFKDPQKELIDPALKGTRNVLNAATKSGTVKKVVLTSSVAAVHGDAIDMQEQGLEEFTEDHWNQTSSLKHQPYSYSKTLAEKEAWKMHDAQDQWKLLVINPSFVIGPSLTKTSDSESINLMKDMLGGKYKTGMPELWFGFVDVRDVAKAHLLALEKDYAEGRHILAERTMSMLDYAGIIGEKYGDEFKLPKSKIPKWMVYMIGWMFGMKRTFVKRNVDYPIRLNSEKSKRELGLNYTSIEESAADMVEQMTAQNLI